MALARPRRRACGAGVRAHEPVRADPRAGGLGRHLARAAARPRRLARVRGRPVRRRSRTSSGCGARVGPFLLGARSRCVAVAPRAAEAHRPRPALLRRGLLADADAAAGALRPLRAAARARARRCSSGASALVVPLALVAARASRSAWSVGDARELTRTDTRLRADAWIAAHVPRGDRIAADPSTLPLAGRDVLRLELPGPGRRVGSARARPRRGCAGRRRSGWSSPAPITDRVLAAPRPLSARGALLRLRSTTAPPASPSRPASPGSPGPGCGSTGSPWVGASVACG